MLDARMNEHEVEVKHLDSEIIPDDLKEQLHRLPAEIWSMIMDEIFKDAFGPRKVHPHLEQDSKVKSTFMALDKKMYRRNCEIYWSINTWVIGKGSVSKTMQFMSQRPPKPEEHPKSQRQTDDIIEYERREYSLQVPNQAALNIRSMELSFSSDDANDPKDWYEVIEIEQNGKPHRAFKEYPEVREFQGVPEFYKKNAEHFISVALRQWQHKFDRVAVLNLRHLTLDLMDASVPDGEYLGVKAAELLIPFCRGLPADFKILAPSLQYEEQIRNIFHAKNC